MNTEDLAESRLLADTDEEIHAGNSHTQQTPSTSNEPSDIGAAFTLFQSYLDKKLVALKDDLREETRHTTHFVASKIKETSELSFKFKGNQQQHKFDRGLADKACEASSALERKNISQVSNCLAELAKSIKRRNKLIRLADKSPAGWDLTNEYLSDEFASGSEDEKKIRKAEKTALSKRNSRERLAPQDVHILIHQAQLQQRLAYIVFSKVNWPHRLVPFNAQLRGKPRQQISASQIFATDICLACRLSPSGNVADQC